MKLTSIQYQGIFVKCIYVYLESRKKSYNNIKLKRKQFSTNE